jgi:uncharacterized DUF497 family protein
MNVTYTLHGIKFEWDSRKAASNLKVHGVTFETACEAFFDPFVFAVEEPLHPDERRDAIIGMTVNWRLLYVVYVLKGDLIRIISARLATKTERRQYEDR